MSSIFNNRENAIAMVQGAYKKLKAYLYYDKTLAFAKKRLAILESDRDNFINVLENIAQNISNENILFFDNLIEEVDFRVLPKRFKSSLPESNIINATVDHSCNISKVNFFIDMPIELYIVDFLWTILVGKLITDRPDILKYAGATAFKPSLYTSSQDLIEGIDFKSNRAFKPYFSLYTSWRNGAFKTIQNIHPNTDSLLLCLDLKSFYYSVDFNFSQLDELLNNDSRLEQFSFLTSIIKKIYYAYTKLIVKYKKGVKVQKNNCIFPIGITSAIVLREIYLYGFDSQIVNVLAPKYYNRYVDDILIVLETDTINETSSDDVINKYLINTGLVAISGAQDLKFYGYSNIRIQKDKVNCFFFPQNQKTILLDIYAETIHMNSSEANLLPDTDVLSSSFTNTAYNIQNLDISNKIRELGFLRNNNYNATRFVNALLRLVKNTHVSNDVMNQYFEQIEEFYQGSQSVEYSNSWRSLFELYLLCGENVRARSLYLKISEEIKKLSFELLDSDELLEKKKGTILKRLIIDLKEKLDIATALTTALNYSFGRSKRVRDLAVLFRKSNMLNHSMVAYPLLNYSSISDVSLTEINISRLFENSPKAFELDKFALQWSPRFISTVEFYIADYLHSFNGRGYGDDPSLIHNKFIDYNQLGDYARAEYVFESTKGYPNCADIRLTNSSPSNPKVALVNTNISVIDALNAIIEPQKTLTLKAKVRLFKILNIAKEEKVDILVFPEYYFPLPWLLDISMFALKNHITIITGLQYITVAGQAYNTVCNFVPSVTGHRFVNGFMLFREKNFYAPDEVIELSRIKHICRDQEIPYYYRVSNGKYTYSTILCYEFTDITSRATMKSKIELLFVPQLNKDTNYFSAIVESTARDLHCFVVQANTSAYGDSRITAPYKTESKNILQVKGGETDVVMIATLNVEELIAKRNSYRQEIKRVVSQCYKCKYSSTKIGHNKKCDSCKNKLFKGRIKGTPPDFK